MGVLVTLHEFDEEVGRVVVEVNAEALCIGLDDIVLETVGFGIAEGSVDDGKERANISRGSARP